MRRTKKATASIQYAFSFMFSIVLPLLIGVMLLYISTSAASNAEFHTPAYIRDIANLLELVSRESGDVYATYTLGFPVNISVMDNKLILQKGSSSTLQQQIFIPTSVNLDINIVNESQHFLIVKSGNNMLFTSISHSQKVSAVALRCTDEPLSLDIKTGVIPFKSLEKSGNISIRVEQQGFEEHSQASPIIYISESAKSDELACRVRAAFIQLRQSVPSILIVPENSVISTDMLILYKDDLVALQQVRTLTTVLEKGTPDLRKAREVSR